MLALGEALIVIDRDAPGVKIEPSASLDRGRRTGRVHLSGCSISEHHVLAGGHRLALHIGRALAATEAAGGAAACTEASAGYARSRIAFGRPIGQFQAVKHHCANMLAQSELATAAAWDAVRAIGDVTDVELPTAVAAAVALPAYLFCARLTIQVHGGIGFTWEHDAHLFLRRAMSLIAIFGPIEDARETVLRRALAGERPRAHLAPSTQGEALRSEVRAFAQRYQALPEEQRRDSLVESGFLLPHWPAPWGRAASPAEQLIIDEELADVPRDVGGGWVALTLASVGTPEQQRRWVRPSLDQTLSICQLFSEPDAGSDLASLKTKADRADGGWLVNGQKVWTSGAQGADWGYALVRTDPDVEKHAGITVMMIEMRAPGVEVRPLREITGEAHFNEVFLTDVFVPDENVVGEVNRGWSIARATMG